MYKINTSIKSWAEEERPREKLFFQGVSHLSNTELIAILIGSGSRDLSAIDLSRQILVHYNNNLLNLSKAHVDDLIKFKGIGKVKAASIISAFELGRRRQVSTRKNRPQVVSSQDAFVCVQAVLEDLNHEEFYILLLNRSNKLLKVERISIGGVSQTVVDPKIVFKKAINAQASGIILAHNHPSGNRKPSNADINLTKQLKRAGDDLDIKVLDHLIVVQDDYFSFADEGFI